MTLISRGGFTSDTAKWDATRHAAAVKYANKPKMATTRKRRSPRGGDWAEQVRALARLRSDGICELCQCAPADHLHHRQPRRNGDHRIVNALHVCAHCHGLIHAEPKRSATCGWIVHSRADAAKVPVVLLGRRVLLAHDGSYTERKDTA